MPTDSVDASVPQKIHKLGTNYSAVRDVVAVTCQPDVTVERLALLIYVQAAPRSNLI